MKLNLTLWLLGIGAGFLLGVAATTEYEPTTLGLWLVSSASGFLFGRAYEMWRNERRGK